MKSVLRVLALIVGLVGTVVALVTNILYSLGSRVFFLSESGTSGTNSHGWYGLLVVLLALVGSVEAVTRPTFAALAFFLIVRPFAVIASILMLLAAVIAFLDRRQRTRAA